MNTKLVEKQKQLIKPDMKVVKKSLVEIYGNNIFDKNNMTSGFYRAHRDIIVRVVDNKIFKGVICVEELPVDVEEGIVEIHLPKIPKDIINEIIDFFRYVYDLHSSEAIILLWYNFDTKQWELEIPIQVTTRASADYERDPKEEDYLRSRGFTFVGTIHSHGNMGAFHSGTDDHDEFGLDGLHITIGHVMSKAEFACRFIMKNISVKQEPDEVIDLPDIVYKIKDEWKGKVKEKKYGTSVGLANGTFYNLNENSLVNPGISGITDKLDSFDDLDNNLNYLRNKGYKV